MKTQQLTIGCLSFILVGLSSTSHAQFVYDARNKIEPDLLQAMAARRGEETINVGIWLRQSYDPGEYRVAYHGAAKDAEQAKVLQDASARIVETEGPLLNLLSARGTRVRYASTRAPLVFAEVPNTSILGIAERADVDRIYMSRLYQPEMEHAVKSVRADVVWARGVNGSGLLLNKVAVIEAGRIEFGNDYLAHITDHPVFDASLDVSQHKTGVAGIVAAATNDPASRTGRYRGVAWGMNRIIDASAQDGTDYDIVEVSDWAYGQGARIMNCSFGIDTNLQLVALDRYYDYLSRNNFVLVVKSAGNNAGGFGTGTDNCTSPGLGYNVLSVGSFTDKTTNTWTDDIPSNFSSYLPDTNWTTGLGREKPELVACGEDDPDAIPEDRPDLRGAIHRLNSVEAGTVVPWVINGVKGTSFAAPAVTGAAYLLAERRLDLLTWPEATRAILLAGACHNIEGDERVSAQDGVGALVVCESDEIATKNQYHKATTIQADYQPHYTWRINLTRDIWTRVALVWNGQPARQQVTGISTGLTANTLSDNTGKFGATNSKVDWFLKPNTASPMTFKVTTNTATVLTVQGGDMTQDAAVGDAYVLFQNPAYTLGTNLDLKVWDNTAGAYVWEAPNSVDNNWEIARFKTNSTGAHEVRVFATAWGTNPTEWIGIAWAQEPCCSPDFGDAPDDMMHCDPPCQGDFPTLAASDGANVKEFEVEWLSSDPSVTPGATAETDANIDPGTCICNTDGEDHGVAFVVDEGKIEIAFWVNSATPNIGRYGDQDDEKLHVFGWVDLDLDGTWSVGERIFHWWGGPGLVGTVDTGDCSMGCDLWPATEHQKKVAITVSASIEPDDVVWSRFRLDYGEGVGTVTGMATYGEVEDYLYVESETGACCAPDGDCVHTLEPFCTGRFRGIGTICAVCVDPEHLWYPCDSDADCSGTAGDCQSQICSQSFTPCEADDDCDIGRGETCFVVAPACLTQACCEPATGSCQEVVGRSETCPLDTTSLGFATDCDPNCCEQPVSMGRDTCAEAEVLVVLVPAPWEPPVVITITGDNSAATYGDFQPGGGGTCQLDMFNPDGSIQDRGWWHAFSLDSPSNCTDLRIDACCSDPVHSLQWPFLMSECDPCGQIITPMAVQDPVGDGESSHGIGSPFCDDNNAWQTFTRLRNGVYFYPVYSTPDGPYGQYQLHITTTSCAEAACCMSDGTCAIMIKQDCDELGGYWVGSGNIPSSMEPVVSCDFGVCDTGSCCTGPSECRDDDGLGGVLDYDLCVNTLGGTYKGGAMCDYPEPPCPRCGIMGANNCQLQPDSTSSFNLAGMSDLGTPPTGTAIADDFIPTATELSTICVFGTYLDAAGDGSTGPEGYEQYECVWKVSEEDESFRMRIYAEDTGPYLPHMPGPVVSEQSLSGDRVRRGPHCGAGFERTYGFGMQGWTLYLDTVPLTPGETYWLEVTSDRNVCPDGECVDCTCAGGSRNGQACDPNSTCYWHWWQTYQEDVANDWAAFGTDDRPEAGVGNGYIAGGGRMVDLQWCLGGPSGPLTVVTPPAPTGACCDCDDTCMQSVTLAECANEYAGFWSLGKECWDEGVCLEWDDSCDDPVPTVFYGGLASFDTTCYTTDGPEHPCYADEALGKDVWLEYTATCTGELVASMCMSGNKHGGYDSFMAVYHDPANPFDCPCPGTGPAPATTLGCSNEGCNGISDGGAGIMANIRVSPGECYLFRVGGYGAGSAAAADAGRGLIDVACIPSYLCLSSTPAQPETLDLPFAPISQKIRYLSFIAGETGRSQALRVTFQDVPAPYMHWNGTQLWVQEPQVYCENAGVAQADPCPATAGGLPQDWFWGAQLGCDPYFTDWTAFDTVHVWNEGIIPAATYDIQVVEQTCSLASEANYSTPLTLTQSVWADLIQDCTTTPCKPPDGSTGIVDVTAVLDKWKNLPGNVKKVRADIEGSPAGDHRVPDQAINITDVTYCLGAFLGDTYPAPGFPAPSAPPVCP